MCQRWLVRKNGKLPLLTSWDGAELYWAAKQEKTPKTYYSSRSELWILLWPTSFSVWGSDMLFRLLKTSKKKGLRLFVKLGSNTGVRRHCLLCCRNGMRRVCRSVLNINGGGAGEITVINRKAMIWHSSAICSSSCNIGTWQPWIACHHVKYQPAPQTTFFPPQIFRIIVHCPPVLHLTIEKL